MPKRKLAVGSNQFITRRRRKTTSRQIRSIMAAVILVIAISYVGIQEATRMAYAALDAQTEIISPLPQGKPSVSPTVTITPSISPSVIPTNHPVKPTSSRVDKIKSYLEAKNSPLSNYAELIVKESDKNDIPWTLIVAISGKESSFGKSIKPNSHNAWGIMSWDAEGKRSIRSFSSWEESIIFEAKLLGDNYRDNMYKGIQENYCPVEECSLTWTKDVTGFSEEINQ